MRFRRRRRDDDSYGGSLQTIEIGSEFPIGIISSFIGFFQSWIGPAPAVQTVEFTLFDAVAPTAGDRRRSETT
jgi:hypothetical protein